MKTNKEQKTNGKIAMKLLIRILTIILIVLVSLISFVGIYVTDKNTMKNLLPDYILGMDVYGSRNIIIKVDDSTETKKYDAEGNLITEDSSEESSDEATTEENITEVEEPVNAPETLTIDNYQAVKDIIVKRLEYMQSENYILRANEADGTISLEIPEDEKADQIAQYVITKGEFKISDNETNEVLIKNSDLKSGTIQYSTDANGTTVYLTIQMNKEGTQKLKDISNTYVTTTDDEGNSTNKQIKMTLDDQTIITTYFQEEITDGIIQLSIGTSTDTSTIQSYLQQASNIAIFLNTNPMPLTYKIDINRFVYSDINADIIKNIIIGLSVIAALMLIAMIIIYKKNGIFGAIATIGFEAILLIALRYGNVKISLAGIFAIALVTIIEYIIMMLNLKEYKSNTDKDIVKKNLVDLTKQSAIILIPVLIISVVFSVTKWEEIESIGMVFFWAILIMSIYNIIILSVKFFENPVKKMKTEKKEETKKTKKQNKASK